MHLSHLLRPILFIAILLSLGGFAAQGVHGEGLAISGKTVPVGQELGEQTLFFLNRNDFYGNTLTDKIVITAYNHWQDSDSAELVITTWIWAIDYTGGTPTEHKTQIGQVRLLPDRPVIAETAVTMLPDGHATRFYWFEEGRWFASQAMPAVVSEGLKMPQVLLIPADGQMLRWQ